MKLAALALAVLGQGDLEAVREARFAGRFEEAWSLLEETAVPAVEAERERVELYYAAGLPLRALEHVERGLEEAPGDLGLLHRGLSLSEWVGDAARMGEWVDGLAHRVTQADLTPAERTTWVGELESFRARHAKLTEDQGRRGAAVGWARSVAISALGAALLAALWLSRPAAGEEREPG